MLAELARLTKQVLALARKEEVCRQLMTVPGVGPITALMFRATIDRPDRFRRSRDVGAHLGLTPARYQSGETDISGQDQPLRRRTRPHRPLRGRHTLLVRSRKWSSLRAWGMKVAKARGMAPARVAVARKLAVILHRMWSDGTEFRFARNPASPRADQGGARHYASPERVIRIVPVGTMGKAISLRVQSLRALPRKVVGQIETPCSLTPSCGGPAPTAKRSE